MNELARRVHALRQPLQFAAADGFRGLDRVRDLGATLRAACDRVVAAAPAERASALEAWRRQLERFEALDRDGQSVEIARGLRLCQAIGGRAPDAPAGRAGAARPTGPGAAASGIRLARGPIAEPTAPRAGAARVAPVAGPAPVASSGPARSLRWAATEGPAAVADVSAELAAALTPGVALAAPSGAARTASRSPAARGAAAPPTPGLAGGAGATPAPGSAPTRAAGAGGAAATPGRGRARVAGVRGAAATPPAGSAGGAAATPGSTRTRAAGADGVGATPAPGSAGGAAAALGSAGGAAATPGSPRTPAAGADGAGATPAPGSAGGAGATPALGSAGGAAASPGSARARAAGADGAGATPALGSAGGAGATPALGSAGGAAATPGSARTRAAGAGGAGATPALGSAGGAAATPPAGSAGGAAATPGSARTRAAGAGGAGATPALGSAGGAAATPGSARTRAAGAGGAGATPPAGGAAATPTAGSRGAAATPPAGNARGSATAPAAAADALDPLAQPVTALAGIGPALAQHLAERGLETVEDLLWFVPRRYDDARTVEPVAAALAPDRVARGERVTVSGVVARARFNRRGRTRWLDLRLADRATPRVELVVRWFNVHGGMADRFPAGAELVLSGRVRERAGAVEMSNPDVLAVIVPGGDAGAAPARIIPRHADVPGVAPAILRKACAAAVARAAGHVPDGMPPGIAARLALPPLAAALDTLHAPPADLPADAVAELNAGTSVWQRRLAFDELFFLGLAVARRRRERRADAAAPCPPPPDRAAALARALPFALTGAQARAIDAIAADLAAPVPMNRLLQGDVGAGKTAVAFAAAHQVVAARRQVALMAPTEILAEQHAAALARWCEPLGVRTALLTASTPSGVRASLLSLLAAGAIDIVVGTHSLLSSGVGFARLGLCIVDEQHRFGVAQRVRLRDKGDGEGAPHLLVMTATPIPRTLALTAYGDLDVTTLDELPPGRTPPRTRVLAGPRGRDAALRLLRAELAAGARAFVVCPLVEPPEEPTDGPPRADATSTAAELAAQLAPARVGLVHGRMTQPERERAMTAFRDGALDVLVATTVIEVGVDVPEATLIAIEDADSFGLAQLHQLRGRVGRGGGASHCLLLTRGGRTATGAERLAAIAGSTDGFAIAEEDLRMRGPGELLGARQAGLPKLRFGDLALHIELVAQARAEADRLLDEDPDLARPEHAITAAVLEARTRGAPAYGAEGG